MSIPEGEIETEDDQAGAEATIALVAIVYSWFVKDGYKLLIALACLKFLSA